MQLFTKQFFSSNLIMNIECMVLSIKLIVLVNINLLCYLSNCRKNYYIILKTKVSKMKKKLKLGFGCELLYLKLKNVLVKRMY